MFQGIRVSQFAKGDQGKRDGQITLTKFLSKARSLDSKETKDESSTSTSTCTDKTTSTTTTSTETKNMTSTKSTNIKTIISIDSDTEDDATRPRGVKRKESPQKVQQNKKRKRGNSLPESKKKPQVTLESFWTKK